jgi:hypothetical protein
MGYKDKYKNMGRSNLTFLNADGGQSNHEAILASIEKEKQDKLKAIPFTLSVAERQSRSNVIIAEANAKVLAENARYEAEKAKRMDDLFGRIGNIFTTTQAGLTTLGITPPPRDGGAPVKGQDSFQQQQQGGSNKNLLIIGGVVLALGLVGFVIYKARK